MNRPALAALLAAGLVLSACSAPATSSSPTPSPSGAAGRATGAVTVLAAASLNKVFEKLATQVEAANPGLDVVVSYDGSNTLVDQLAGGAKADVLATADEKSMDRAVSEKLVGGQPQVFATNVLTLVVAPGNPAGITGVDGSLSGKRLVVCAPAVPCGAATQTLVKQEGLTVQPVSEENRVTDVLGKVTSGEADAGVVYRTDAKGAGSKVATVDLKGADRIVNRYPIAAAASSPNQAGGQAFIAHVLSPGGQAVLANEAGFGAP